jgi:hypothetical protein
VLPKQIVSGYLETEFGASWMRNTFTDDNATDTGNDRTWLFAGAGRVNVWWGQNWSTQFDVWGGADTFARQFLFTSSPNASRGMLANGNIGAHASYRVPGSYLVGAFGALGGIGSNRGPSPTGNGFTHGTLGVETQAYLGMLTLYLQAGAQMNLSPAGTGSPTDQVDRNYRGGFVRGVARYYVNENLRLEGWGLYAAGRGSEDFVSITRSLNGDRINVRHTAWGAGIERRLQDLPFSFFVRYEGGWTSLEGVDTIGPVFSRGYTWRTNSHAAKAGFRVYLSEGTLRFNDQMGATLDIRDGFTSAARHTGRTTVGP